MKTKISLIIAVVIAIMLLGASSSADADIVELPELVGNLEPYPNGSTAAFDFGTPFLSINEVKIQMAGTFTPGLAQGDGVEIPVDEWLVLLPEIHSYMDPGVGACFAYLHPLESPFNIEETFELKYSATWAFLLDGTDQVNADLGWGGSVEGWVIVTQPTVQVSEAYLITDGVVPEPATVLLLAMGAICARITKLRPLRKL